MSVRRQYICDQYSKYLTTTMESKKSVWSGVIECRDIVSTARVEILYGYGSSNI